MSEFRKVGRHMLVYGAGIVASKLVSLVMLRVYTSYLTPANFGVLELLETTVDVIGMIGGMGLAAGVFKHHAELETREEQHQLLSTVLLGNAGLALGVSLVGIAASGLLTRLIFGAQGNPVYFRVFFVAYFFQSFLNLALASIQVEERSDLYVGLTLVKLVVTLSLNIWFVVGLRAGVMGVLLGNTIGSGLVAMGLAIYTFRRVGVRFSTTVFRKLSKFGAPVGVATVGSFILTFSDRYFLNHFAGTAQVGIYSVGYQFGFLLSSFAVVPFTQIWEPRRFAIAQQPGAQEVYQRMFFYLNLALFGGAIAIELFIRDGLTLLVGPAFVSAYHVVPLILAITIVQQLTTYCNFGLYLKNSTNVLGWAAVAASSTALALNWLLIPRFGMFGAAWATVAAYVVRFIPIYATAQARYHVRYPWRKAAWLAAMFGGVLALRHFADALSFPVSVSASLAMAAAVAIAVYFWLLGPVEREFIGEVVRRPSTLFAARFRIAESKTTG